MRQRELSYGSPHVASAGYAAAGTAAALPTPTSPIATASTGRSALHSDKHPENFSVSEAGYHCFACGASGGLWPLAEKLGGHSPQRRLSAGGMTGGVARVHACTRAGGVRTLPPPLHPGEPAPRCCTRARAREG